ncbi:MAG TPA: PIN domain-containing protein [Blastocatellia bacterium]|nr:PIN domain-containing protein [Blastocatellia bacterium]
MGALSLPASGVVYIDTARLIYSVEKHPEYEASLRPLWAASKSAEIQVITSELALLETLVGPLKHGDAVLADVYSELLTATEMRLLPITLDVLRDAARLRADTNMKTPDAIHAATALAAGCDLFVTNDGGFRRVAALPVVIISEVAQA